jgi:hypothetical protein
MDRQMRVNLSVNERSACRACGSNKLIKFLEFPDISLVDDYLTANELGTEFLYPLRVYLCENCSLVQTQHDIDIRSYYEGYHYSVASSPFAQRFMRELAQTLFERYGLRSGDSIGEIGSSDGFQLQCFKDLGARVFGFEPSANLTATSLSRGVPVAQTLFLPETVKLIPADLLPLKLVLLTYTFDHLSDPLIFLKCVRQVLDPTYGLLVIEVHNLAKILERREYCLFEHEHPTYWTVDTMRDVLRQSGFKLLDTNLMPERLRRANSLLVVAAPEQAEYPLDTDTNSTAEYLRNPSTYRRFAQEVERSLRHFQEFVRTECSHGQRLAGYGAGGRGITTLAMSGIGSEEMAYLCDMNSSIHGRYTPKSHLPLVGPEHLLEDWVNEVIVFSFGYMQEIATELSEYTAQGGKLISLLELL